jgi:hypothetical protein
MLIKLRKRSVQFIEQETESRVLEYQPLHEGHQRWRKMWLQLVYRCLSSLSDGGTVFRRTCKLGLEGIVSKRKDSAYCFGRSPDRHAHHLAARCASDRGQPAPARAV